VDQRQLASDAQDIGQVDLPRVCARRVNRKISGAKPEKPMPELLTGFSNRLAHDYGFLDTDLPFERARQAFRIDEAMRPVPLDEHYSKRLREVLKRQGG
jgi:hypothetical protein